jgi:spore coat polysaccharide biosynthesis predicted glycosyltransferase SpsG
MNILIYTYGNHQMGMGHVYRMLNLSHCLKKKGHTVIFLSPSFKEGISEIKKNKEKIVFIPKNSFEKVSVYNSLIKNGHFDCIIADALDIAKPIMKLFKRKSAILLSFDNIGEGRFFSDILINVLYRKSPKLKKPKIEINSFDYLILNDNFKKFHLKEKIIKKEIKNVLITQGGSDTYGIIPKITIELNKIADNKTEYYILIGPAFRHFKELTVAIKNSDLNIKIVKNIKKTWELFYKMDMAISGGGMTLFELLCVGIPSIALTQEYKEIETIGYLEKNKLVESLGLYEKIKKDDIFKKVNKFISDYNKRMKVSKVGKEIIDGGGGERICDLLENYLNKINKI